MMHRALSSREEVPCCFSVICQISRSQGTKKSLILTRFERFQTVTSLWLHFEFTNGFEMLRKAWLSLEEVRYCFSRSTIKFQDHMGQKIDDLKPIWVRLLGRSQLSDPLDLPCYPTDVRTGDWKRPRQKHGIIPVPSREGCIRALLQAALGKTLIAQQERIRRFREEYDLKAQGESRTRFSRVMRYFFYENIMRNSELFMHLISKSYCLFATGRQCLTSGLLCNGLIYWCSVSVLTHWGWVTHICVSKLTIIGSDNGLSPGRRQAIIWTNDGILLIRTLGTNFSEIVSEIHSFSFKKMHLKMSSAKWCLFCLGLNELTHWPLNKMAAKFQIITKSNFINENWLRKWPDTEQAVSHYFKQWWLVIGTSRNKLQCIVEPVKWNRESLTKK